MQKFFMIFMICLGAATSAKSDTEIAHYWVELGREDFFNSSGTRLTDGAAIFQQDRANFHRFGIRHGGDSSDPVFSKRAARAEFQALLRKNTPRDFLASIASMNPNTAARPGFADYRITICGSNGRVTRLILNMADGDWYEKC